MRKVSKDIILSEKSDFGNQYKDTKEISFERIGFILRGNVRTHEAYTAKVEMSIDGKLIETMELPASFTTRRHELFWKYQLPKGKHTISF